MDHPFSHRRTSPAPDSPSVGPKTINLSIAERQCICASWEKASTQSDIGCELVARLLNDNRTRFRALLECKSGSFLGSGNYTTEDVNGMKRARSVADGVNCFFNKVISKLMDTNYVEEIQDLSLQLGAMHFRMKVWFQAENWLCVKNCLLDSVVSALLKDVKGTYVICGGLKKVQTVEKHTLLQAGVAKENVNAIVADVTSAQGQDLLISSTLKKFGRIDILINNAGANIPDPSGKTRVDCTIDNLQEMFKLNLQSVVEITQKARPHLAKSRGEIVNISSIGAGPSAQPQSVYYSSAKAALDQYSRCAAIDLISEGIRINVVQPGFVSTGFSTAARGLSSDESLKFYNGMGELPHCIPAGYCGQPEHLASVIAFLADRKASEYIVGQTIIADGGTSLVLGMHANFGQKK